MKSAVLVIDMVKDNLELSHHPELSARAKAIVPAVNRLTAGARARGWPVVFATDSFLPGDFLFRGRMGEHSLRGTEGAEVSALLEQAPEDTWLPKRRMSAFFKTDLDQTLRLWGVERVLVCGIMTPYCVLTTALDAVCHDFAAVMVEDASNAPSDEQHRNCLDLYRRSPLRPLLRVATVEELLAEGGGD
jgi:nicotinamidase-related amidase